jgi:cellulose synthase operon protein C
MRKTILAALALLIVVVGGYGGYRVWRHFFRHEPLVDARADMAHGNLRAAQLELRDAVGRDPNNPEIHFRLGVLQLQFGDPVAAEKELTAARAAGWPDAQVVPPLARAYLAQQHFHELLRDLPPTNQAHGGLPPEPLAALLVSRSLAQIALQDANAALASATEAERLAPRSADAALAAGRIARALGDPAQALQQTDRALQLNPKLLEAIGLKADILRAQGDVDQALAQFDAAVAVAPLPRVRLARARALLSLGEDAAARTDVEAALKQEPRNTFALYLLAVLQIRARDWAAADTTLEKIQPVLTQLPRGEYYRALVKANVNQLEQAAESAGRYVARAPSDANGFRLLARIDLALGQQAPAAAALQKVAELGGDLHALPPAAEAPGIAAAVKSDAPAGTATSMPIAPLLADTPGLPPDSPEALTHTAALQLDAGDNTAAAQDLEQSLENVPRRIDTGAIQVLSALAAGDIARATAALEQIQRQPHPDPAEVGNLTGLVRMAQVDYDGARKAWEEAARSAPDSVQIRINLAHVLALQGDLPGAENLLTALLAARPANRAALVALVEIRLAEGRVQDAITAVQAARKAAPGMVGFLVTEAALQAHAGNFTTAFNLLDEVPLELAKSPQLLGARAEILLLQGNTRDAADAYRQILLNNPGESAMRQRLIRLLVALKQVPEALRLAQDGLARQPGNSVMLQTVALLTLRNDGLDAALAMADAALHDPASLPAARLLKGGLYMAAKRYDDAAAAYAAEAREDPFSQLVITEAVALRAAGHPDQATTLLRDWVARQPDPTVSQTLAAYDIEAHQLDEAQSNLESVLAVRPSDAVALNNLAWIYQQKQSPKARDLAEKAYLLAPGPQTADTLGWILVQQGDVRTGLLLLRRALVQLKDDPAVQYHLAAALQASGQHDEASRLLTALLARPVTFNEKPQALKLQQDMAAAK